MVYLLISMLCSVLVSVLLKVARSRGIRLAQAVAVNYIAAIVLTVVFLKPNWAVMSGSAASDWWLFGALGVLLPTVFVIMGRAAQQAGIVKADAAQRLSLFLPILAAFTLFGQEAKTNNVIGLLLAFSALFCLLYKSKDKSSGSFSEQAKWLLGVFFGYGVIDILMKQLSNKAALANNLFVMFVVAAVVIFAYLMVKKTRWSVSDIWGGLLLGCLNFSNILFYIKAHRAFPENPALVFAGMNMGVIVLGTLTGVVLFREKISRVNALGIVLALSAIVCLFYWK